MKINIKEILFILSLSIGSAVMFQSVSANGVDYIYKPPAVLKNTVLSLNEAKKIFDAKEALFIDARPEPQYKHDHIRSAINVPYNSNQKERLMTGISKEKYIVVYCYSKRCNQARRLEEALKTFGFKQVVLFEDGISEWKKAKYPID